MKAKERKLLQATHNRPECGRQGIEGCGRRCGRTTPADGVYLAGEQRMRQCGKEDAPIGSREAGGRLSSLISLLISDALCSSTVRRSSLAAMIFTHDWRSSAGIPPSFELTSAMDALTSLMSVLTPSSSDSSFSAAVRAAKALLCVSASAIAVPAGSRREQRTGTQCHHTTDIMRLCMVTTDAQRDHKNSGALVRREVRLTCLAACPADDCTMLTSSSPR
jgi:hypothetical protein